MVLTVSVQFYEIYTMYVLLSKAPKLKLQASSTDQNIHIKQ